MKKGEKKDNVRKMSPTKSKLFDFQFSYDRRKRKPYYNTEEIVS